MKISTRSRRPNRSSARPRAGERGAALLTVVVLSAAFLVAGAALSRLVRTELHATADQAAHTAALYAADAGVQHALARLERDRTASPSSATSAYSATVTGGLPDGSTYSATIEADPENPAPARKRITSTGSHAGQSSVVEARAIVQTPSLTDDPSVLCPILFADQGKAELATDVAVLNTRLFDGEIFSNGDAQISVLAGVSVDALGTVRTAGDFYSNSLLNVGSILDAELFRGGDYLRTPLDQALLGNNPQSLIGQLIDGLTGIPLLGGILNQVVGALLPVADDVLQLANGTACTVNRSFLGQTVLGAVNGVLAVLGPVVNTLNHLLGLLGLNLCSLLGGAPVCNLQLDSICPGIWFSNGEGHRGEQVAVDSRPLPIADFEGIKTLPTTVVVSEDFQPFGTWNSSTGTWEYDGTLVFPGWPDVTYYVEGNARIGALRLAEESRAAVVARGSIAVGQVSLLNVPLVGGLGEVVASLPLGPVSPLLDVVDGVVLNPLTSRGQNLWLVARDHVLIGGSLLPPVQALGNALGLGSVLDPVLATGIDVAEVGLGLPPVSDPVTLNLFAYAETGDVGGRISTLSVDRSANVCLVAGGNASISQTAEVGSSLRSIPAGAPPF